MRVAMLMHTNTPWAPLYARWFLARGDEVLVVSFHPDRLAGVPSVFLGTVPFDKYRNKHVYGTRLPRVRRLLREFAPDVVFAPYLLSNGLMAAAVAPAPIVVAAMGGDVLDHPDHPWWRRAAKRALVRPACLRARRVLSVAPHLSEALRAAGVPAAKIVEFPIGVDRARFHPRRRPRLRRGRRTSSAPAITCRCTTSRPCSRPSRGSRRGGRAFRASFAGGGNLLEATGAARRSSASRAAWSCSACCPTRSCPSCCAAPTSTSRRRSPTEPAPRSSRPSPPGSCPSSRTCPPTGAGWIPDGPGCCFRPATPPPSEPPSRALWTTGSSARGRGGKGRCASRSAADLEVNMRRLAALLEAAAQLGT